MNVDWIRERFPTFVLQVLQHYSFSALDFFVGEWSSHCQKQTGRQYFFGFFSAEDRCRLPASKEDLGSKWDFKTFYAPCDVYLIIFGFSSNTSDWKGGWILLYHSLEGISLFFRFLFRNDVTSFIYYWLTLDRVLLIWSYQRYIY